jgi:hypothetical protein
MLGKHYVKRSHNNDCMRQSHTTPGLGLSTVTAFVARHPRAVVTVALLVVTLAFQGTVSAETATFGDSSLLEPTAGHGASTGP